MGRITIGGQPRQKVLETPISKITIAKMDWRCGSSGRAQLASTKP
jgi:hypothetical protein